MKVLITGATGLIGRELGKALVRKGHEVFALSRNALKAESQLPFPATVIEGDPSVRSLPPEKFSQIEAVIHLAGENVGESRWTSERKRRILNSRVDFTRHLIESLPEDLKVFISASATGYYGNRADELLNESSSAGSGFLADVCVQWEKAVEAGKHKISESRLVILRTGVVLAPFGGALMKMLPAFQMGIGGVLGSGKQWMSWIHLQDLVSLYVEVLENSQWQGVYNAVSPEPVTNRQFTKDLCAALAVRQGPPVPALALNVLYGEMGSVILDSQRVQSQKLHHFSFQYPDLRSALQNCAGPYRGGEQIFYAEQYFPFKRETVFSFFLKAENLEAITPPSLHFEVEKVSTPSVQKGSLIDYKLKIHGVPVVWQTLIEDLQLDEQFIDTQLKGPYSKWRHIHSFEDLGSGTLMTDLVKYKLPVGKIGQAFGGAFVRADVEKIFAFRHQAVPQLLGK